MKQSADESGKGIRTDTAALFHDVPTKHCLPVVLNNALKTTRGQNVDGSCSPTSYIDSVNVSVKCLR